MNWGKLSLFTAGLFFGGALDHAILAVMRSETTPYGFRSGVRGNWLLSSIDLALAIALFAWHERLIQKDTHTTSVIEPPSRSIAA